MQLGRGIRGQQWRGALSHPPRRGGELTVLQCYGGPIDGRAAQTLYDLLGASPDDDAEGLKGAFRRAVRANHPDLHPGDPGATERLSGIVRAYAILRDAHERASYNHALGFEHVPPRPTPKRAFVSTAHFIVSEAAVVAVLAVMLVGGFALLANGFSGDRKAARVEEQPQLAPVRSAASDAPQESSEREAPHDKPAGVTIPSVVIAPSAAVAAVKSREVAEVAGPVPRLLEREAAKENFAAATDQLDAETGGLFKSSPHVDRFDQDQHPKTDAKAPAPVELSSLEDGHVAKPPSPEIAIPEQKDRPKAFRKPVDAKPSEPAVREKQRAATIRQPTSHSAVTQASLEGKGAPPSCGQSCLGNSAPPLLGVGF